MIKNIHPKIIVALLVLFVFTFNVTGVIAAVPLDLHIEVTENIPPDEAVFVASGTAVESGLICERGMVFTESTIVHGSPEHSGIQILNVDKHFVCDADNTFDINMKVKLDTITGMTTAHWKITGGTGDYANLKGNGSLIGTPHVPDDDQIDDVYEGKVH